ncbi:MAG TPA: hypothetical protein DCF65_02815 [Chloroflexi bacterium]|nr:hypothetical protein [Chloroflexota bacterium]
MRQPRNGEPAAARAARRRRRRGSPPRGCLPTACATQRPRGRPDLRVASPSRPASRATPGRDRAPR